MHQITDDSRYPGNGSRRQLPNDDQPIPELIHIAVINDKEEGAAAQIFRRVKSSGRFDQHRRIARITFPIWIYVSVTGVMVYVLLFQIYGPVASE